MKGFNPYFSNKYRELLIGMVLVLAVACVYSQVANHEFVNIDDHVYVTNNPQVQSGLSLANMQWAFRFHKTDKVYWHPLVWISHMTDIQLFGLNPGAHHLVNVLFHMLNTLLLFIVLRRMTGSVWSSAFVAALFALHPINVDSVAWIAERKNVLSTFFWLCTMIAYLHYTKTPGIFRYLILVMVFTLGLLTKPMLATLPCVLLLLDYWPLGRIKWSDQGITSKAELILTNCREVISSRVIWEKIPLGVLSLAAIGISSMRLEAAGNVMPFSVVPLTFRIENALVSYVRYIGKMLWPLDLAVLYPFPRSFPLEQTFAAAIALTSITAITLKFWKKYPYLVVGWLWFAGTLIPVSGLMMAGLWPAMADRWVYVPLIGLFVMISWGIPDLLKGNPFCTYFIPAAAGATLLLLAILTFNQTATWRNSRVLFEHAVAVTTGNHMAHNNLGNIFMEHERFAEAASHFEKAVQIRPHNEYYLNNLGLAIFRQHRYDEAMIYYLRAIARNPGLAGSYYNAADACLFSGRDNEALEYYRKALHLRPGNAVAENNVAEILIRQEKLDEAIIYLRAAIRHKPDYATARNTLASVLTRKNQISEAIDELNEALRINPRYAEAINNLSKLKGSSQTHKIIDLNTR